MGQSWPLLFIFVLFTFQFKLQLYILNNLSWKKCWWCAWDLNLGRHDGRCRRIHWAMAAPLILNTFITLMLFEQMPSHPMCWHSAAWNVVIFFSLLLKLNFSYFPHTHDNDFNDKDRVGSFLSSNDGNLFLGNGGGAPTYSSFSPKLACTLSAKLLSSTEIIYFELEDACIIKNHK